MPKRLRELERERREEQRKAERWLRNHPDVGDLPGRRFENGESATPDRQHVERSTGSYSATDTVSEWEEMAHRAASGRTPVVVSYDENDEFIRQHGATFRSFIPLVGQRQQLSPADTERRERMEYVLTFLLPDHQDLLRMRHVERMTLEAIGKELGVSHVAVIHRLDTAEQDFRREYGKHYEDPGVTDV